MFNSIAMASIVFLQKPMVSSIAFRNSPREYTIVANGGSRTQQQQFNLVDFINQTLAEYQPIQTPLSETVELKEMVLEENGNCHCCSICLEDLTIGSNVIVLNCGHTNHSECLRTWFRNNNTCPECRAIPN